MFEISTAPNNIPNWKDEGLLPVNVGEVSCPRGLCVAYISYGILRRPL